MSEPYMPQSIRGLQEEIARREAARERRRAKRARSRARRRRNLGFATTAVAVGGAFLMPAAAPGLLGKLGAASAGTKFMVGATAGQMASSFIGGDEGYAASFEMTNNAMSMIRTADAINEMVETDTAVQKTNADGTAASQSPRNLTRASEGPVSFRGRDARGAQLNTDGIPALADTPITAEFAPVLDERNYPPLKTAPQYDEEDWLRLKLPSDILASPLGQGERYA
jgi:hypothetical protein